MNKSLNDIFMANISFFVIFLVSACILSCNKAINYSDPEGPVYQGNFSDNIRENEKLRVVTFNTKHSENRDKIIKLLGQTEELYGADVILLQEADEESTRKIAKDLKYNFSYIPSAIHPKTGKNFGNAILSKWDIVDTEKIVLPETGRYNGLQRSVLKSLIKFNGSNLQVYNVHFSTVFQLSSKNRYKQFERVFDDAGCAQVHQQAREFGVDEVVLRREMRVERVNDARGRFPVRFAHADEHQRVGAQQVQALVVGKRGKIDPVKGVKN